MNEIGICPDCFMVIEMGATTEDEAILNGVKRLAEDGYSYAGAIDTFSHSPCDCCGSPFGGLRHIYKCIWG